MLLVWTSLLIRDKKVHETHSHYIKRNRAILAFEISLTASNLRIEICGVAKTISFIVCFSLILQHSPSRIPVARNSIFMNSSELIYSVVQLYHALLC